MTTLHRFSIMAVGLVTCATLAGWPSSGVQGAATTTKAYFAGGCFWSMELAFEQVDGVLEVVSGYMGGTVANPTYDQVSAGKTGHVESVEVTYDPSKVSYHKLLDVFWHNIDPVTPNGQFCDYGNQYRTAIFYTTDEEKQLSEESKSKIEQSKRLPAPIVTRLAKASSFYPAEDYHQDFYKKNPIRYNYYKLGCGRAKRLEALWGKP